MIGRLALLGVVVIALGFIHRRRRDKQRAMAGGSEGVT